MKTITFTELLEILGQATAIQIDGILAYPVVDNEDVEPYFDVEDVIYCTESDVQDLIINDCGNIEFTYLPDAEIYTISVLEIKKLGCN